MHFRFQHRLVEHFPAWNRISWMIFILYTERSRSIRITFILNFYGLVVQFMEIMLTEIRKTSRAISVYVALVIAFMSTAGILKTFKNLWNSISVNYRVGVCNLNNLFLSLTHGEYNDGSKFNYQVYLKLLKASAFFYIFSCDVNHLSRIYASLSLPNSS